MTSRRSYWCPKTMKRRPCWCPKPILWELNSFLMQTLSFVPMNLHRCSPREWKHSILARLIFSSSKYCRHRNCYSFKNCVALLPLIPWLSFWRPLQTYVISRAVTEQIVTQRRRLVEFRVPKWLKIDPVSPFYSSLWQLCNGKTYKKYEKRAFRL